MTRDPGMVKRAWFPVFRRSLVFDIVALSQQRIPSQTWQIVKCGEMTKLTPYLFFRNVRLPNEIKTKPVELHTSDLPFLVLASNKCL